MITTRSCRFGAVVLVLLWWNGSRAWGQLDGPLTTPVQLNTNADTDSGDDQSPQMTTDGSGNWVAVWESKDDLGGTIGADKDILFSLSTDQGATWSAPQALNSNADSDSGDDQTPQVTTDGSGNWVAAWESKDDLGGTIGADRDILFSLSTDQGATWSTPQALNSNADSDSGDDQSPQVTTEGAGNWVAAWESKEDLGGAIGADKDVLCSRSTDQGATWSAPQILNTNADSDSGDDRAPQVTTDGSGHWMGVWGSDDDLGGTIGADLDILLTRFALPDCNANGVSDSGEIAAGTSQDCNTNGVPDECEADADGDGTPDACDGCPGDVNKSTPGQCGCGNADTDTDSDGAADCLDNCPDTSNPDQADFDRDGIGDLCDEDADGDGFLNATIGNPPLELVDCDDLNAEVSPAVVEVCDDEVDNDCDALIDEDCSRVIDVNITLCLCGSGACGAGAATALWLSLGPLCGAKLARRHRPLRGPAGPRHSR